MKNIFITGLPGIGKTTVIRKVLELCSELKFTGFYTSEIRENNIRKGFKICSISGRTGILAHENIKGPYRVGKYGVNLTDLEEVCVKEMRENSAADVIVIDEIGKMEVFSDNFCRAVEEVLDSNNIVIGTISRKTGGFINKIYARDDVKIIEVTYSNRNSMPEILADIILDNTRLKRTVMHE